MNRRQRWNAGVCAAGFVVGAVLTTGVLAWQSAPAAAVACTDLCPIIEGRPDPGAATEQPPEVDAADRDLAADGSGPRQDQVLRSDAGLTEMLSQFLPGFRVAPQAIARVIVPPNQFDSFDQIITHESSWNVFAINPSSGAYGLPQALPAYKMFSAGMDWPVNPVTQIRWAYEYMNQRYGSPNAAWAFWQKHHWY